MSKRTAPLLFLLAPLLAALSGCYVLSDPLRAESRAGPFPYTHVRTTAIGLAARIDPEIRSPRPFRPTDLFPDFSLAVALVEMPFSFVADTLLLPYTGVRALKALPAAVASRAPENTPQ